MSASILNLVASHQAVTTHSAATIQMMLIFVLSEMLTQNALNVAQEVQDYIARNMKQHKLTFLYHRVGRLQKVNQLGPHYFLSLLSYIFMNPADFPSNKPKNE